MALPTDGRTLNNIVVTTLDAKLRRVTDLFFNTNAAFERMYAKNKIKYEGGEEIRSTILYNAPTSTSYTPGGDTADTTETEIVTDLVFNWKAAWCPININGLKLAQNAGGRETKFFDLLDLIAEAAANSLADKLGTMFFLDGTGNSNKDFDGLLNAVVSSGSYGGITINSTAGDPGNAIKGQVDATGGAMSKALLQTDYQLAVFNRARPDLILTTNALFSKLWERVEAADRNAPGPARDAGFETIRFNGAEVVVDSHVASGYVWMLNTDYIEMWCMEGHDFVRRSQSAGFGDTGFPVFNSDMYVDQLHIYGDFIVPGPRYQVKITNVS